MSVGVSAGPRNSTESTSSEAAEVDPPEPPARRFEVPEAVRRRLESVPAWEWRSWAVAGVVTLIAAILRFVNLGHPTGYVFDEVYYAIEGQELLERGVEWRTETDSAGNVLNSYGDFVVHPPLGKWIIALGIRMFGNDGFGWRFMAVVCGVLSVLIITRTARRMFDSTVLGATAGLLMALDGFHFVLSRTAILDVFVMFFVVAAFGCLVLDRDHQRRAWLAAMQQGLDPSRPGRAGRLRLTWATVPWWRLAAGLMVGFGCAVKWSAIFVLPVFLVLIFFWGVGLRRTVGAARPWRDTLLDELGWLVAVCVLVLGAYLASWTGWFMTDSGWKRHYFAVERLEPEPPVIGALRNLWYYHVDVLRFHEGLNSSHPYQSWPWQWLLMARPVAFYRAGDIPCGAAQCNAEITLLGTPVLWWAFVPALVGLAWFGISRRDWRAAAIGAMVFAGFAPWFYYELKQRTMFLFYASPVEPFLILAVVYCLGALINGPGVGRLGRTGVRGAYALPAEDRRLYGTVFAAAFVTLVAICFWWYYPLYVGESIPYEEWMRRMLLGNRWI